MIGRTWHGVVPEMHAERFEQRFRGKIIGEIAHAHGNRGAFLRRVDRGGFAHFFLVTYWSDLERHSFVRRRFTAGGRPVSGRRGVRLIGDPIVLHHPAEVIDPWFDT